MNFKVGDKVLVITGQDKGKEAKILKVLRDEDKVVLENINKVKKHQKADAINTGGIVEVERAIHISNIMHIDPKSKKRTRISKEIDKDGKKVRIAKKSGEKI